jgi:hypothetical protein
MKNLILPLILSLTLTIACGGESSETTETNTSNALYPECTGHSECSEGQFCGIECWTGGCGEAEDVPADTLGQYCQPCDECESGGDSVTGDCAVCD